MFKVYVDMLKSDKQRVKGGQTVKFGYLPMRTVATLGVLNAESFCERVLSSVKLVLSNDSHASDEPWIHGVYEENLPRHTFVRIQDR